MKSSSVVALLIVFLPLITASHVHQRCFSFSDGSRGRYTSEIIIKAHTNTTALFYPLSLYHSTSLPRLIDNTVAHSSDSGISFCTKEAHEKGLCRDKPVGRFLFEHTPVQTNEFTELELTSGEIAHYPVHTHGVHCVVVAQSGKQENWPPAVRMQRRGSWQSAELNSYVTGNLWILVGGFPLMALSLGVCDDLQVSKKHNLGNYAYGVFRGLTVVLELYVFQALFVVGYSWLSFYNVTASNRQCLLHFWVVLTEQLRSLLMMALWACFPVFGFSDDIRKDPGFLYSTNVFFNLLTGLAYLTGSLLRLASTLFDLPPRLDGSMRFLLSWPWVAMGVWVSLVPFTFTLSNWNSSKEFSLLRRKSIASYIVSVSTYVLCFLWSAIGQILYHKHHSPDSNWLYFYSDTALWHWLMGPQYAVEYETRWSSWLLFWINVPSVVWFFLIYIVISGIMLIPRDPLSKDQDHDD